MRIVQKYGQFALLVLMIIIILFPILWGVMISLKTRVDALTIPPKYIFDPTFKNYYASFTEKDNLQFLLNSVIISLSASLITIIGSIPAAYTFSRFRFKGDKGYFFALFTTKLIPATVIGLPIFLIFAKLKLVDNYLGIILIQIATNIAVAIWILKIFFDEIPKSIDDAARVDGATWVRLVTVNLLPNMWIGITITWLFSFVAIWNEFYFSLILTTYDTEPLTVSIPSLVTPHGTYWGQVAAISTVSLVPGIVLVILIAWFWKKRNQESK